MKSILHFSLVSSLPSLPVRGAWIEIYYDKKTQLKDVSLPVRGAWIEIIVAGSIPAVLVVAPCEGSVD